MSIRMVNCPMLMSWCSTPTRHNLYISSAWGRFRWAFWGTTKSRTLTQTAVLERYFISLFLGGLHPIKLAAELGHLLTLMHVQECIGHVSECWLFFHSSDVYSQTNLWCLCSFMRGSACQCHVSGVVFVNEVRALALFTIWRSCQRSVASVGVMLE